MASYPFRLKQKNFTTENTEGTEGKVNGDFGRHLCRPFNAFDFFANRFTLPFFHYFLGATSARTADKSVF